MESILKHRLAYIAFGGNMLSPVGNPTVTCYLALGRLVSAAIQITAVSRFFRTPAYPAGSGPEFVNGAARLSTSLSAQALLERLHLIESQFARERRGRWSARTLDLDLIGIEQDVLPDKATVQAWMNLSPDCQRTETPTRLLLPHPRLQDRAFVLIPLAEIAPEWRHPLTGKTVAEMADALSDAAKAAITPF